MIFLRWKMCVLRAAHCRRLCYVPNNTKVFSITWWMVLTREAWNFFLLSQLTKTQNVRYHFFYHKFCVVMALIKNEFSFKKRNIWIKSHGNWLESKILVYGNQFASIKFQKGWQDEKMWLDQISWLYTFFFVRVEVLLCIFLKNFF